MADAVDTGIFLCRPDDNVSKQGFNDWYNIHHAPYRLAVPGFHTATDALSPSYSALYDLTEASIPSTPAYTSLGATATAREKTLVPRLAILNRSVFSLISMKSPPGSAAPPSTAYPTPYVMAVTILVSPGVEADFNSWYKDEDLGLLAAIPGCVRIRRYKLHQSTVQLPGSRTASIKGSNGARDGASSPVHTVNENPNVDGTCVQESKESKDPEYNYLMPFDLTRDDFVNLPEFAAFVDTPWSKRVLPQVSNVNTRRFKLHTVVERPE